MPTFSKPVKYGLMALLGLALVAGGVSLWKSRAVADAEDTDIEESTSDEEEEVDTPKTGSSTPAAAPATTSTSDAEAPTTRDVSKEEMVTLLNKIFQQTQMLAQRLIMQQNSPKPLSPESLKQTFDMNSEMIHQQVLSSMRISHSSFMAAMNKHKGDTAVRTLIGQTFRITQLMEQMCVKLPDVPEDMTIEKFLPALDKFMAALISGTEAGIESAKGSGLSGEELAHHTMEQVGKTVPKAQDECLAELDMDKELFQACLKKYMADPRVQNKVAAAQQSAYQLVKDSSPTLSSEHLL